MAIFVTLMHAEQIIQLHENRILPDINECDNANGGCQQICDNIPGSYVCSCNAGYDLNSDGKTCSGTYLFYYPK